MLDLVKQETERIDSRFLEPACGTGNFLTEILERKLQVVESLIEKANWNMSEILCSPFQSIYGIDILEDNVMECRKRLFEIVDWEIYCLFKKKTKGEVRNAIQYILEKNIIWGDALDLKTVELTRTRSSFRNGLSLSITAYSNGGILLFRFD